MMATGGGSGARGGGRHLAPLPLKLKLGYSAGQIVDGVITNALNVFLLFYVTAVCGLPGGLAGAALAIGLIVDAVVDPLIGSSSDGWRSRRFGRRLPFMLAGLGPILVTFVLIFSLPQGLGQFALFGWLTLLSVTLRISLSLFILPFSALGAELSDDYAERSVIMAWRWGIGMLGALVAIVIGFGVFFAGRHGLSNRAAYTPFALTLCVIAVVGAAIAGRTILATRDREHAPTPAGGMLVARAFRELAEVWANRSFRILFASALLFFIALGVHTALGLHANIFFWHLDSAQTQMVTLSVFAGLILGAPLAGPFLARLEKKTILIAGVSGLILAQGAPATLRLLGLLPLEGFSLAVLLSAALFVGGAMMSAAGIAFASMMADAADEHEDLFAARREGLYFAGWAFAGKAAGGAGSLIAGLVLQLIGFPTGIAGQATANAHLPAHTVAMLGLFYGPGAALISFASVAVAMLYRLDRSAHADVMGRLAGRRAATSTASILH